MLYTEKRVHMASSQVRLRTWHLHALLVEIIWWQLKNDQHGIWVESCGEIEAHHAHNMGQKKGGNMSKATGHTPLSTVPTLSIVRVDASQVTFNKIQSWMRGYKHQSYVVLTQMGLKWSLLTTLMVSPAQMQGRKQKGPCFCTREHQDALIFQDRNLSGWKQKGRVRLRPRVKQPFMALMAFSYLCGFS